MIMADAAFKNKIVALCNVYIKFNWLIIITCTIIITLQVELSYSISKNYKIYAVLRVYKKI